MGRLKESDVLGLFENRPTRPSFVHLSHMTSAISIQLREPDKSYPYADVEVQNPTPATSQIAANLFIRMLQELMEEQP